MALMVLGGVVVAVGLFVLLFMRDKDTKGEMRFKYKDFEVGSTKPSIFVIGMGVILIIIPNITGGSPTSELAPFSRSDDQATTTNIAGSCCTSAGKCTLSLSGPSIKGTACFCMDFAGNMATGAVCE